MLSQFFGPFLLTFHGALYNGHPEQVESLLHPHQIRCHGLIVDDVTSCHLHRDGKQGAGPGDLGDGWDGVAFAI